MVGDAGEGSFNSARRRYSDVLKLVSLVRDNVGEARIEALLGAIDETPPRRRIYLRKMLGSQRCRQVAPGCRSSLFRGYGDGACWSVREHGCDSSWGRGRNCAATTTCVSSRRRYGGPKDDLPIVALRRGVGWEAPNLGPHPLRAHE